MLRLKNTLAAEQFVVDRTDIPNRFILVHEATQNFLLLHLLSGQVQDGSVSLIELELLIAD